MVNPTPHHPTQPKRNPHSLPDTPPYLQLLVFSQLLVFGKVVGAWTIQSSPFHLRLEFQRRKKKVLLGPMDLLMLSKLNNPNEVALC